MGATGSSLVTVGVFGSDADGDGLRRDPGARPRPRPAANPRRRSSPRDQCRTWRSPAPHLRGAMGDPPERIIGSSTALTYQDDPDREPAYAAGAERVLDAARSEQDWAVISVKHDWSRVFADE
jgi:hypothetical protein